MRRFALLGCLIALLAAPGRAQRPRSADDALAAFDRVKAQSEAQRRRAAGDLGAFAEDRVTAVLLDELARANDLSYRQAVVRALGECTRSGVANALLQVLREASNPRLLDSAAEGLARQGDEGVQALASVLAAEPNGGPRRNAACDGLGRAEGAVAREALLKELQRAGGRDRLPALRALQHRTDEAAVDRVRLELARDKDVVVAAVALAQLADHNHAEAAPLAMELHRRLGASATAEQHAAVLQGLLRRAEPADYEAILVETAEAQDPFGKALLVLWQKPLGAATFVRWLVETAPTRKAPNERRSAAEALGRVATEHQALAGPGLVRLLGQREPEVVRAAATALSHFPPELANAPLEKLLASGPESQQVIALEALHDARQTVAAWRDELLRQCAAKSASLRTAALQLLARCEGLPSELGLAAATPNLSHKAWSVRAAAYELLVALRAPAAVPLLFERLDLEATRLHEDLVAALRNLTGLQFPTTAAWRAWWQKEGPTFVVPPPPKANQRPARDRESTTITYWNLPVCSDRVAFVVDVSGSMNQPFGTGANTRLDEAKRQLGRVLGLLPAKAKANVIAFGNDASAFAETLQSLDDKHQKAIGSFVQALVAHGATNVHAALQRAFADAEVDTIFLLTDGQPSAGPIVDGRALAREVQRWNTGRGLRIHTVAIGGKSPLLELLAADSGGEATLAR